MKKLKIKDNINLKELEKFGFKYWQTIYSSDGSDNSEWLLTDKFIDVNEEIQADVLRVDISDRKLTSCFNEKTEMYCRLDELRLTTIYYLIKADIVEVVDE